MGSSTFDSRSAEYVVRFTTALVHTFVMFLVIIFPDLIVSRLLQVMISQGEMIYVTFRNAEEMGIHTATVYFEQIDNIYVAFRWT